MSEQLTNWLIGAIVALCGAIGFLYKSSVDTQAKLKEEHQATMVAMLTDAKAERLACQKDNELMRQDIAKLQDQLIKLHQEHGELKGRLSSLASQENHAHDHV